MDKSKRLSQRPKKPSPKNNNNQESLSRLQVRMHGSFIIIKNTLFSLTIFKQIIKLVSSFSSLGLIGNSWKLNFGSWQSLHRSIRKKILCSYSQNDVFPALTNYSVVILTFLEQFDADWTKPIAVNDIFRKCMHSMPDTSRSFKEEFT